MKYLSHAVIAALGLGVAASAAAYDYDRSSYFDYAHVERVDRIVNVESQPVNRQECWQEPRDEYHPGVQYQREELSPSVEISANGRETVHSEVVERGGYVTRRLEEKCVSHMDYDQSPRTVAYDVVYAYRGQEFHDRMNHDPGTSVRVRVDHGYVEVAE